MGRFQNKFCIDSIITSASQEKESKVLSIAMKEWHEMQLALDNSKSQKEQGDY